MRISEYPFNPRLLIGAMMKWIPEADSVLYTEYIRGKRWVYKLEGIDNSVILLSDLNSTYCAPFAIPISYVDQLEIIG